VLGLLLGATAGCDSVDGASSLSKSDDDDAELPRAPPPPENGPKLGSIANRTPIFERPSAKTKSIGQLHAGALIARSPEPLRKTRDCPDGYFGIFPRGYVCLNQGATLDLAHPTLAAMAIRPALDQPLPYTYARTTEETPLLERDLAHEAAVREAQKLPKGSGFAVVGSWSARLGDAEPERLGLLTNGRFVRAQHLKAAEASSFSGYEIGEDKPLPVAFVVKRGVRRYKADGETYEKDELLDYHATLPLSGKFRTVDGVKYWTLSDKERFVRNQDVTIIHRRAKFPDFVRENVRWIDVGVILGTLVAYEGQKPVFATLVSSGRDRLGNPELLDAPQAVTKLGTFEVVSKTVSLLDAPPERLGERFALFDVPWAIELSSGQLLHGAYWHDRFGIEHGSGDIMLAPADAQRLFGWVTPDLPKGWHSASAGAEKTIVHVHK
jgi:hypothetical protein